MKLLVVGIGNPVSINSLTNRVRSGGETKLLAMLKIWSEDINTKVWYMTSYGYASEVCRNFPKVIFIKLPEWIDKTKFSFIGQTLFRVPLAAFINHLPQVDIIYSASDLLFDLMVAVVYKIRQKQAKLVVCLFLIAQKPTGCKIQSNLRQCLFYFFQQISILLIKLYANCIFVLNNEDKKILIRKGFKPEAVFVTSGGISPEEIKSIKRSRQQFDCVFVGRFHPQKGIFLLLDVWRLVIKKKTDATLVIIGGGTQDYIDQIKHQIDKYNLRKSVELMINIPRSIALSYMKSGRIFTFPSTYESWGFVVAEAMAMGKPVVRFDILQLRNIFREGTIKIACFDIHKYANAIINLLSDVEYLTKLSQFSTKKAIKYNWNNVAQHELIQMRKLIS